MTSEADPGWDAFLDQWQIVGLDKRDEDPRNWPALIGEISFDRRRRWPDGRRILTSKLITDPAGVAPGAIVETRNTRYLLGRRLGAPLH